MSAIESIVKWAMDKLPNWQSDAVRRSLTQDEITQSDENEIVNMIKKTHGIVEKAIEPRPIKRGEISGDNDEPVKVTLKAMKDLKGVNAIPDGSGLNFGHQGLNVIYGENGAGKSGYARVLKRACKARDKKEKIYSNVFSGNSGQAQATFKISVNDGADAEISWIDGQECESSVLTNINVFDSKCARVIVDDNNEVTYLPYGAHVFESLVDLIKRIKIKLEAEKPIVEKLQYPDIVPTTVVAQFIDKINYKTDIKSIETLATWDSEDEKKLLDLIKYISKAEINDSEKVAKRIRILKERIQKLYETVDKMNNNFSALKVKSLEKNVTTLISAEEAAIIASQEMLSEEPLHGAGENAWQLLYNAAKKYSTEIAYPDKDFPVTEDGGLCVLCMQPLLNKAKVRMQKFKKVMEDTTQKQAERAMASVKNDIKEIRETPILKLDSIKDIIDEIRDRDMDIAKQLEEYLPSVEIRANQMVKSATEKRIFEYQELKSCPTKGLLQIIDELENEAKEVEKSANPEELKQKKNQKSELSARKLFVERKQEIIDYVKKVQLLKKYENCIAGLETRMITQQGKKIVSGVLTPILRNAIGDEIKALGATHLPLNLKPSGSGGETRHKMELDGCQTKKVSLSEILSEGEQRVVAIAGFMAELRIEDNKSPIVLDDPVSSLDHRYRENIAERIIKESASRQVIVFTHDIAFLLALKSKAGEMDVYFCAQTVRRTANTAGNSMEGLPWHALSVRNRVKYLNGTLTNIRSLYTTNQEEYNYRAGNLYGLIRETWESLIEEVLFYEAIRRHSAEVKTMRLKSVTVTTEDYKIIHINMSKSSTWMIGHDKSKTLDANRPSPEEILKDIDALQSFAKDIRKRHEELRKEREASLQPQRPDVG